jgi:hypothetical protein
MRPMIAVTAGQLRLDRPGGWAFEPNTETAVQGTVAAASDAGSSISLGT